MKIKITALLVVAFFGVFRVSAQSDDFSEIEEKEDFRRKGFIGISLGPSLPVGKFASKESDWNYSLGSAPRATTGLNLNLINFGYRFSNTVGITAKLYGGAHNLMINKRIIDHYEPWSYAGLLAGPLICFPISKRVELDFRPMIGLSDVELPVDKNAGITVKSKTNLAYAMSANLQFHLAQRIGLQFGFEYFHTKATFTLSNETFKQNISTINSTIGLFYRFN